MERNKPGVKKPFSPNSVSEAWFKENINRQIMIMEPIPKLEPMVGILLKWDSYSIVLKMSIGNGTEPEDVLVKLGPGMKFRRA